MSPRLSPLAVYCGAAQGVRPAYAAAARALGRAMTARGVGLVYGGGRVGLMGEIADAMLAAALGTPGAVADITGIITHDLMEREIGHRGIPDLRVVNTLHERKMAMATLARGFVALPGGVGTLDELFEVVCWAQLAIHRHPIGLLNTEGYYDKLIDFLDHAAAEGFLRINPRAAVVVETDPERLLDRMQAHINRAADLLP